MLYFLLEEVSRCPAFQKRTYAESGAQIVVSRATSCGTAVDDGCITRGSRMLTVRFLNTLSKRPVECLFKVGTG